VPDLEHSHLACSYCGTSQSVCQNISNKFTI